MPDNALALIQAKITETEEKLAKLRVTERELSGLTKGSAARSVGSTPVKRGRPPKVAMSSSSSDEEPRKSSLTGRLRDFLKANSPSSALAIAEGLSVETRPISFALQTLKRKGEVKSKDGEWSIKGRR